MPPGVVSIVRPVRAPPPAMQPSPARPFQDTIRFTLSMAGALLVLALFALLLHRR